VITPEQSADFSKHSVAKSSAERYALAFEVQTNVEKKRTIMDAANRIYFSAL